jgi:hypothetical protein
MARVILLAGLSLLLCSTVAHAVTIEELPKSVTDRLPGFIFQRIDADKMKYLTVEDFCEFADAYESGILRFVNKVDVQECGGPLTPELAELVLQIPPQAPYVEDRFVRIAKWAYGKGIFGELRWAATVNADNSVDITLWYKSNNPKSLLPELSYGDTTEAVYALHYRDLYYGMEDKQVEVQLGSTGREPDEVTGMARWADNTLNDGANAVSAKLQVENQWRTRYGGTPLESTFRDRIASTDLAYSWKSGGSLTKNPAWLTLGVGAYHQNHWVYTGDPTAGGTLPRSNVPQAGTGEYVSLGWSNDQRDHFSLPRSGSYSSVVVEQHFGEWDFTRLAVDLRRYKPVRNLFGVEKPCVTEDGCENDIALQMPTASFAVQAQVNLARGDIPYSQEQRLGNFDIERGYSYDRYPGIRVAGLREEYRFALDDKRQYEMYVFNDNAWVGETFQDLEALNSVGAGAIMRLPILSRSLKVGAYYAHGITDDTSSSGLSVGYAF